MYVVVVPLLPERLASFIIIIVFFFYMIYYFLQIKGPFGKRFLITLLLFYENTCE